MYVGNNLSIILFCIDSIDDSTMHNNHGVLITIIMYNIKIIYVYKIRC